jgi:hypothetical protein
MNGYITWVTSAGPKVIQVIKNVDRDRRDGEFVEFMRGPRPPAGGSVDELLEELQREARVGQEKPQARVVAPLRIGKGMITHVGDSPNPGE